MRNSPSCNCCGPPCDVLIFNDPALISEFTVLVGSWSTGGSGSSSYFQTGDSVAAIVSTVEFTTGIPWIVSMTFVITPSGAGDSQWRIGVGSDTSNYNFVQFYLKKYVSFYSVLLKLGEQVTGSDTFLAVTLELPTNLVSGTITIPVIFSWDHESCLNIYAETVPGSFSTILSKRNVTALGTFAGIFVQGLNGTLKVKNFMQRHGYGPDTLDCAKVVQSCTRGVSSSELTLELDDSTPASYRWHTGPNCDLECSGLLGTNIAEFQTDAACLDEPAPSECGGDNCCRWLTQPGIVGEYTNPQLACIDTTEHYKVLLYAEYDLGADEFSNSRIYTAEVYWVRNIGNFGGYTTETCELVATFQDSITDAMEDWVVGDWYSLPELGTTKCNTSSNLTFRMKRHV